MERRVVVVGGWRAYLVGAAFLAVALALVFLAGLITIGVVAAAAIGYAAYRALRGVGIVRSRPRSTRDDNVIEGEYRVVERHLPEVDPHPNRE